MHHRRRNPELAGCAAYRPALAPNQLERGVYVEGVREPGEEPWQAAVRELHEETLFTGTLRNFRLRRRLGRFWLFEAEVDREFRPVLDHEHLACRWALPGRPPVPLHPGLDGAL